MVDSGEELLCSRAKATWGGGGADNKDVRAQGTLRSAANSQIHYINGDYCTSQVHVHQARQHTDTYRKDTTTGRSVSPCPLTAVVALLTTVVHTSWVAVIF